ncbi:glycoside hydrolase family 9 protein [Haloferula sp. BvORR071]|uniref:glycoside hydrolase family 9 protein n=1 Tax=Haloferula sp. BvORR071 TaxID=1396141 RepID=UPI0009DD25ED|nr:glycoside hydrolase family 9 protein [Haloferula sp. BvORR071]
MSPSRLQFISFLGILTSSHAPAAEEKEPRSSVAAVVIHANQVVYDLKAPKVAVVETAEPLTESVRFRIAGDKGKVFEAPLASGTKCEDWFPGRNFYRMDFSGLAEAGKFHLEIEDKGKTWSSTDFEIGEQALPKLAIPAITGFYKHQRADSKEELEADRQLLLHGSDKRVDLRGGWCDASGDVSKYFSHLAYTRYMCPQQTPLVVWSMVNTLETAGPLLEKMGAKAALQDEALYGAEYLLRSLSDEGYFYMTVFSYFKKDPSERRVVGLLADSKTTDDYQCAFRDGGGMGIAALARISKWKKDAGYLEAAERAFAHLQVNNLKYADDHKENIIDDHCALLAATELWIATEKPEYRDAARDRAAKLIKRQSPEGYFIADGGKRPYWHASDAGLPVLALARYLDKEAESVAREPALAAIRAFLDYQLRVTAKATNPFGYARQSFLFRGEVKDGFFIPHENESGWWWQGENARLGSLAAAAIVGGRLVYPDKAAPYGVKAELGRFAADQVAWILGGNPYDVCFMYEHGKTNVPYMKSMFGHGSGRGGISNGITGKNADGSGIDFHFHANGNEWRWTEQWIPHSAWFLQAVTAMSSSN